MKVIGFANEKGGVGKTFCSVQFSFFTALQFNFKTVLIDLDAQGNASDCLKESGLAKVMSSTSNEMFLPDSNISLKGAFDEGNLALISAPDNEELSSIIEQSPDDLLELYNNFQKSLKQLEGQCDVVIFDSSPSADIRSNCVISFSDVIVSPIQLANESIKGVSRLLKRVDVLNDVADVILLVNMAKSNEQQNFLKDQLIELCSDKLLFVKQHDVSFNDGAVEVKEDVYLGAIKDRSCFAVAQGTGQPIWKTDSNAKGWSELRRVFYSLLEALNVDRKMPPIGEFKDSLERLKIVYPDNWKVLLRQYWMTNSLKYMPKISNLDSYNLFVLREKASLSLVKPN